MESGGQRARHLDHWAWSGVFRRKLGKAYSMARAMSLGAEIRRGLQWMLVWRLRKLRPKSLHRGCSQSAVSALSNHRIHHPDSLVNRPRFRTEKTCSFDRPKFPCPCNFSGFLTTTRPFLAALLALSVSVADWREYGEIQWIMVGESSAHPIDHSPDPIMPSSSSSDASFSRHILRRDALLAG